MIAIVDYGLGNVQAIGNIYKRLDIPFAFARTAEALIDATHIILPGVGAFDWAMERLENSGMRGELDQLVCDKARPVLGICVGMHMMGRRSDEGAALGLGWLDAEVRLFDQAAMTGHARLPHMGWNDVEAQSGEPLFRDIEAPRFYFLHSYYFAPQASEDVIGATSYGGMFASAVRRDNVMGVQFHPEKSHQWGIQLLKNFADI